MAVSLIGNIDLSGSMSAIASVLYVLFGLVAVGGGVWFVWTQKQYKVRFIIRKVTGDRTLVFMDWARIIRKKGLATKWKLKKRKDFVPVPPREAIDVSTKGKLVVECYYTEDGEYVYIADKINSEKGGIGSLYPVKNTDKEFYQTQCEEGMKKYQAKTMSEILLQLAPMMILVIIFTLFLVFFDKTVQPSIEFAKQLSSSSEALRLALETMNSCSQAVVLS